MSDVGVNLPATIAALPTPAGSMPLRNPRHERYARSRSLLVPKIEAYRGAGFESESDHAATGNAAKLDRKPKIAARVAWLCRQDEEVLRAKRQKLEEFLWSIHEVNYADFWETVEEDIFDKEGKPTGRTRQRQKIRPFEDLPIEHQRVIQTLKYTDSGRPILETYSKMTANQELRKMLGIGAISREDGDEYSRLADVELIATLRQEAAVLGIDVDLTMRFKGSDIV